MSNRKITSPEICVSIVTRNSENVIQECLKSILEQTFKEYLIYIYDNASIDETLDIIIKYKDERIILKRSENNIGFCGGHNYNISNSKSKYVILVNPDVILEKNYFENALIGMNSKLSSNIGTLCGLLIRCKKDSVIDSAGMCFQRDGRFVLRFHGLKRSSVDLKRTYVDGVDGALPFYRRQMIEDISVNKFFYDEMF